MFFLLCFHRLCFNCDSAPCWSLTPEVILISGVSFVGDRGGAVGLPPRAVTPEGPAQPRGYTKGLPPKLGAAALSFGLNFSVWHPCLKAR